ncbi:MAG: hypothetical protein ABJA78_06040 [Ferruginibacter sp.]
MKKLFPLFLLLIAALNSGAQNFTGQWKGEFTDNSTTFMSWGGDRCEYVVELEVKGKSVTGYSYTYFSEGDKRYYTICRLQGFYEPRSKYLEFREMERTKTNVPDNIHNCFQIHKLTLFKDGNEQKLEGSWIPAPNQEGDCGFGTTVLTKRVLSNILPKYNNSIARTSPPKNNKLPDLHDRNRVQKPVVTAPVTKQPVVTQPPVAKNNLPEKLDVPVPVIKSPKEVIPENALEKRNNTLIKTIELENETFKVDLYDNGDIDGDSVSVIYNGKVLLSHKRLSDKALTLTLSADESRDINELVMYAENLGEIPPNTALMVVTDGNNRYEVRITSDLQKSGTIKFVHKPKAQ